MIKSLAIFFLGLATLLIGPGRGAASSFGDTRLMVTASFSEARAVLADEPIELSLNRELQGPEARVGILIGTTDVTSLFTQEKLRLRYNPKIWPLPAGDSSVIVYVVSKDGEWDETARFTLRVERQNNSDSQTEAKGSPLDAASRFNSGPSSEPVDQPVTDDANGNQQSATPRPAARRNVKEKFTPSLTFTVPSQPAQHTFPDPQPARATFIELTMQGALKNELSYGLLSSQSEFDFAGSSFKNETLRFGTLGNRAPDVDLSSYLTHFQLGNVKFDVGHFSYGTQRQLINGFSSRGLQITVPFMKRFDFTAAVMNGTQLVGYDNFFGINRSKHRMVSGTLGIELERKRPGGLRLEVSALNAYFQPISGVNRGVVTDLQRSNGVAVRLIASDKAQRFHFEGGFTRSFFASPSDPTLNQGAQVVPLPNLSRNAHYLQASYQILKEHLLTKSKKANLTVAFQEENVAPLFRSLGASTQADKIQYSVSVNGSINDISAQFSRTNFHDNLRGIPSILRTLNGNTHFGVAAPMSSLLNLKKPSVWLPRLGYSFDRNHAFAAAIPANGGFEFALAVIPNLVATNQTFTADWQVKKFTWGYNVNHSFQDNRQPGRERADLGVLVNTGRVGIAATSKLQMNFDLSAENNVNKETGRIDHTYRVGPGVTWQLTKHFGFSTNLANTIAGNVANTSDSRNTDWDASLTYRFVRGKEGLRKISGQFFIRYANHYSHAIERLIVSDTLRKNQTLTANLGITFF
jgi:hypothetical protein